MFAMKLTGCMHGLKHERLMRTRSRMPPSYIVWLGFHRYWAGVEHWIGEM